MIGELLSSVLNFAGTKSQNDANREISSANNAFNAEQNERAMINNNQQAGFSRDFQAQQSATQYQRAVGDMSAAGLNPMLAYSQGGNSAASGATASTGAASSAGLPRMENALGSATGTALNAAMTLAGIDKVKAETANVNADTLSKNIAPDLVRANTEMATASAGNMREQTKVTTQNIDKVRMEIQNILSQTQLNATTGDQRRSETSLNAVRERLAHADADLKKGHLSIVPYTRLLEELKGKHSLLDIPRATNESDQQSTLWKKFVAPYLGDIGSVTGSAAKAARMGR